MTMEAAAEGAVGEVKENNGSSDLNAELDLPSTVQVFETKEGNKVYVVGTAHFSVESQQDVSKVIQAVRPNIVVVELCSSRMGILQMSEEKLMEEATSLTFQKMKDIMQQYGTVQGLFYVMLLKLSKQVIESLGTIPGGEFRQAFEEVSKIPGCVLHLGDRPILLTIKRAVQYLSWWNLITLSCSALFTDTKVSQSEVEQCKNRDMLQSMLDDFTKSYPAFGKVFVYERDVYLTYSLQKAAAEKVIHHETGEEKPATVVGVVGIGHLPGITEHWGTVKAADIIPIITVPPTATSTKIMKFTLKVSALSLVIYGCSKVIPPLLRLRR